MFELHDRVAVVSGGSRGIGRAVCLALAARGARVVVGYGQGEQQARDVVEQIFAAGGNAEPLALDLANMKASEQAVAAAGKRLGRLDILVEQSQLIGGLLGDHIGAGCQQLSQFDEDATSFLERLAKTDPILGGFLGAHRGTHCKSET